MSQIIIIKNIRDQLEALQALAVPDEPCHSQIDTRYRNPKEDDFHRHDELWQEVDRQTGDRNLSRELYRALWCKAHCNEESLLIGVPPLVDQAWHVAILNTSLYSTMCEDIYGQFIPHSTKSDRDSVAEKNARIDATIIYYRILFGEDPDAELWQREVEQGRPRHELVTSQIFLKMINGSTICFNMVPSIPIILILRGLQKRDGTPWDLQRLIHAGKNLGKGTLGHYVQGDITWITIHVLRRLIGC